MKKAIISILLTTAIFTLCSCGKTDTVQVSDEVIETAEQPEQEQETENIINDEPEQETEQEIDETLSVEPEQEAETEPTEEKAEANQIDIIPMDCILYAQSAVNIRSGDSTDYPTVGTLSKNEAVHVTGQSKNTLWYQIDGTEQFVSNKYLDDNPVEKTATTQDNTKTNTGSTTTQNQTTTNSEDLDVGNYNQSWADKAAELGLPAGGALANGTATVSEGYEITDHTPTGLQAE